MNKGRFWGKLLKVFHEREDKYTSPEHSDDASYRCESQRGISTKRNGPRDAHLELEISTGINASPEAPHIQLCRS